MPERLDRVTVSLECGDVILTWDARQAIMRRLQYVQETARLRDTFEAVGASQPVELTGGQRTALLLTLEGWSLDLDGHEAMPEGLFKLRDALIKDLHNAGEDKSASNRAAARGRALSMR
jgi:hypothetical protein